MGNCLDSHAVDRSITSQSTTRPSYLGTSNTTSNNGRFSGTTTFSITASDDIDNNGEILPMPNMMVYSLADLKSTTRNFKSDMVLGVGGFGTVYKGWVDENTLLPSKCGTGMMVAIKKLNPESVQGFQEWQNFNAKISDFGLAKIGPSGGMSHVTTRIMGTYGYAAPEYIATGHLYVKSDVYGFGVLLLEMLTGLHAMDKNRPSVQHNLVEWARPLLPQRRKLKDIMDARIEGQYSSRAAYLAAQLTLKCLESEPRKRPSMKEVLEVLEQIHAMSKEKSK